jgi:hypothetical protein
LAQASVFSSIMSRPASDIALVCSCLQTPATASVTSTETILSTTVATPFANANNTITPSVVTIQTTETATITEVISVTDLTSTTITETSIATATATSSCSNYFNCNRAESGGTDAYTCGNSNCLCAQVAEPGQGVCTTGSVINGDCSASVDCPSGNVCIINTCRRGGTCVPASDAACPNPGGQAGARRRFRRAAAYKSEWNELFGRSMDM